MHVSDPDFFFDEDDAIVEETPEKRATAKKAAAPKAAKKVAAKTAKAPADAPTSATAEKADAPKLAKAAAADLAAAEPPVARKSTPSAARPAGGIFEQNVSMSVAALMTIIGVLVGVIIGFVVAPDGAAVSTGKTTTTTTTGTTGTTGAGTATAPQLSEDQLSAGALPEGHPDIGSVATDTATPAAP